jgi:hypothetical protein
VPKFYQSTDRKIWRLEKVLSKEVMDGSDMCSFLEKGNKFNDDKYWYQANSCFFTTLDRATIINKLILSSSQSNHIDIRCFSIEILALISQNLSNSDILDIFSQVIPFLDEDNNEIRISIMDSLELIYNPELFLPLGACLKVVKSDISEFINRFLEKNCVIQRFRKFYSYEIYQKAIDRKPIATARGTPTQNTYEIKAEVVQIIENNYGTVAGNHNSPQEPPC